MNPHALLSNLLFLLLSSTALPTSAFTTRGGKGTGTPSNAVLLTNVKTLTLRKDKLTSARRTSAIPQLTCVGGNAKGLYDVDVMRCTNSGSDYDDANVQWTCKASLPPEFKLGATDVTCEGYDSVEDPAVLKGSCGVEYRLVLTEAGERKYGHREEDHGEQSSGSEKLMFGLCVTFIIAVVAYGVWNSCTNAARRPGGAGPRGGGGGNWWGGDDDNGPPPPYSPQPPRYNKSDQQSSSSQGWRPGFWSGTAAGAAAGYLAGNRGSNRRAADPMVGSSRWAQDRGSGSSAPTPSSSRVESTGFGGTRRR